MTPELLSDAQMQVFVDSWIGGFTSSLSDAWPDREKASGVIRSHILEGFSRLMGPMEIADYFHISYPGVVDEAIGCENEREQASALFEQIMQSIVENEEQ